MALRHILSTFLVATILLLPTIVRADTKWFSVWSSEPDDSVKSDFPEGQPATNEELANMLKADVGPDKFFETTAKNFGEKGFTYFWIVLIDEDKLKQKYGEFKLIATTFELGPDEPENAPAATTRRRKARGQHMKRDLVSQANAPRQLKFLSDKDDTPNLDDIPNYRYDDRAGKGVRVYIMDSGLNFDSNEWDSAGGRKTPEILFAGFKNPKQRTDLLSGAGHGTCMADLAVGRLNGVAKEADLTAVQLDDQDSVLKQAAYLETQFDALVQVVDDIASKGLKDKAVVSWSTGWRLSGNQERDAAWQLGYTQLLEGLVAQGVDLVAAIPNGATCENDVLPCGFANPDDFVVDIITVASGVISDGTAADPDNVDDWVTIYGPGDDKDATNGLVCAAPTGNGLSQLTEKGTSHATAFIAGLMAYFKSLGLDSSDALKRLLDSAYARKGGVKMPYNGANGDR